MYHFLFTWLFLTFNVQQDKTYKDTVYPFKDSSYTLTLYVFNTESPSDEYNAVVTFSRQVKNKQTIIFRDSIYTMFGNIEREDYNNDKVKDIAIFNFCGARANPSYHLYLVNNKTRTLKRVMGFEKLPNPEFDPKHHIVTSMALYGSKQYHRFYRINARGQLINLGHAFEEETGDGSDKYERVIRQIVKEHKQNR